MKENIQNTDRKLLAIISGGETFMEIIDDDALMSKGQISAMSFDSKTHGWNIYVHFPNGDFAVIGGVIQELCPTIKYVKMPLPDGKWENIPVKGGKSLVSALTPLNGIPARLKRCLSNTGREGARNGKPERFLERYGILINDALFWDVEGGDESKYRGAFSAWTVRYLPAEFGPVSSAKFQTSLKTDEGKITVTADADVYGIGDKKVILEKNLGMNRTAVIDCTIRKEGRMIPSLRVAFDLDKAIPVMYWKERKKKTGLGKPRAH